MSQQMNHLVRHEDNMVVMQEQLMFVHSCSALIFQLLLSQVHSDGYISLQTSYSASGEISDRVIAVFLSDVDTSGIGQITYGYS